MTFVSEAKQRIHETSVKAALGRSCQYKCWKRYLCNQVGDSRVHHVPSSCTGITGFNPTFEMHHRCNDNLDVQTFVVPHATVPSFGGAPPVQALLSSHYGPSPLAKWQEKVYRQRMLGCYQDIQIGLWGEACKASAIDKENCAMKCLSVNCYEFIYGADPLEEGELDLKRGRQFRFCVRKAEKAEKEAQMRV